jgi:large subunit ribosomal protein L25
VAEVGLQAEIRNGRGKGVARKLRARGKVPAVLYGKGLDSIPLAVDARALSQTFSTEAGRNVLIDLQLDGGTYLTLARQLDRDPLRGDIVHVDFLKIDRDQTITVQVPVHFEGDSAGVKQGGVLEHHLWQIEVECLPNNVPANITIDVSDLDIGGAVRVADVAAPEGVTFLSSEEEVIVSCVVPQAPKAEEEVAAEAAAAAEGEAAAPAEGGGEATGGES